MAGWHRFALLTVLCGGVTPHAGTPALSQTAFATAERAADALVAANRADDLSSLTKILGPGGAHLVRSGDPVADRGGRARFVAAYDQKHRVQFDGDRKAVLIVGPEEWPLPIPIIRSDNGWYFDARAAEQEILDRRIGRNELSVIEVCRAYVDGQREYAARTRSTAGHAEYAQRFSSQTGRRDGLYWPVSTGEPPSPLGPLFAAAHAGGYGEAAIGGTREPYHGYYFRILTRQGTHAPGGARDFVVGGRMTRGFALVAYPAVYGDSGIMTFIVSQDDIVYEKNLGTQTEAIARRLAQYDPDPSWRTP